MCLRGKLKTFVLSTHLRWSLPHLIYLCYCLYYDFACFPHPCWVNYLIQSCINWFLKRIYVPSASAKFEVLSSTGHNKLEQLTSTTSWSFDLPRLVGKRKKNLLPLPELSREVEEDSVRRVDEWVSECHRQNLQNLFTSRSNLQWIYPFLGKLCNSSQNFFLLY